MTTTPLNPELLEYLHWEVFTILPGDNGTVRVYLTEWEYAEPEIVHNNDELLSLFRETVKATYDGMEDCIPAEYAKYLA